MERSKLLLMSVAVVLFAAGACNKETDDQDGGTGETPEIVVDSRTIQVGTLATTESVGYSVTNAVSGVSLSAVADADWVTVSVGESSVEVSVTTNDTKEDRSATVTLSYSGAEDVSLTVTQVVPVISVTSSQLSVSYAATTETVSYSVTNAVDGDAVTASGDGTVVTGATVDNSTSTVTVTISANTDEDSRTGTVTLSSTYAKDVEVSVVQAGYFEASYDSYIGTWVVTDYYYDEFTIWISENVENESYTVDGWQFGQQGMTYADIGYEESDPIAFRALYDSSTKSLQLIGYIHGTATDPEPEDEGDGVGTLMVVAFVTLNNTNYYITPSGDYYPAATMTMESSTTATITGETISTSIGSNVAYKYQYLWQYAGSGYTWTYYDIAYFPCEVTKVSSTTSTSSVKGSEKVAAPMKSEMKSVNVL